MEVTEIALLAAWSGHFGWEYQEQVKVGNVLGQFVDIRKVAVLGISFLEDRPVSEQHDERTGSVLPEQESSFQHLSQLLAVLENEVGDNLENVNILLLQDVVAFGQHDRQDDEEEQEGVFF